MKALVVVVMMCVAGGVAANEDKSNVEMCKLSAEFARAVMGAHQAGVQADLVIEKASNVGDAYVDLAVAIYGTTRFRTKENQDEAIRNAYNDTFIGCLKVVK
jgi:hypothetical protein